MCNGLIEAGATLKWVYDPDPAKVDKFIQQYPQAHVAASLDVILNARGAPGGGCGHPVRALCAGAESDGRR